MKVKNFPGHKNKRRISVLARLPDSHKEERKILLERIMPQEVANAIRTKKRRANKGKEK